MNINDLNLNITADVDIPEEYLPILSTKYPVPAILNSTLQELPDTEQGNWSAYEIEKIRPAIEDLYYQLSKKTHQPGPITVNIKPNYLSVYKNWASLSRTLRAALQELPGSKTRIMLDKIIIPYDLMHQQIRSMIWSKSDES